MKNRLVAAIAAAALAAGGVSLVAAVPASAAPTSYTNPLATPDPTDFDIASLDVSYTSTSLTFTYHTQNAPSGAWEVVGYALSRADLLTGAGPDAGDFAYGGIATTTDGVTPPSYQAIQFVGGTASAGSAAGLLAARTDANTFTLTVPSGDLPWSGPLYVIGGIETSSSDAFAGADENGGTPIGFGPIARSATSTSSSVTLTWPSQVHGSTPATIVAVVSPAAATGTVSILENGTAVASAPVSNGVAIVTLPPSLPSGPHQLVAQFTPANLADYAISQSGPVSLTVLSAAKATTTKVTLSKSSQHFKKKAVATVKVTVSGNPAGTITIYDGKKALKKVAVKAGKVSYKLSASLKKGTHSIKATFTPKNIEAFKASTSKVVKLKVVK